MRYLFLFLLMPAPFAAQTQRAITLKRHAPVWYAPSKNTETNGISLGLVHVWENSDTCRINGMGIELGMGIVLPAVGGREGFSERNAAEAAKRDTLVHRYRLNGVNISATGSVGLELINGLSINGIAAALDRLNGVQVAILMNVVWDARGVCIASSNNAYRVRGLQLALLTNDSADHTGVQIGFWNESKKIRGVQIGCFNKSKNLHGLQIGLWNRANGRGLPLLNWGHAKPAPK